MCGTWYVHKLVGESINRGLEFRAFCELKAQLREILPWGPMARITKSKHYNFVLCKNFVHCKQGYQVQTRYAACRVQQAFISSRSMLPVDSVAKGTEQYNTKLLTLLATACYIPHTARVHCSKTRKYSLESPNARTTGFRLLLWPYVALLCRILRCGGVWRGAVWCGAVRCGTVRCGFDDFIFVRDGVGSAG